MRKDAILRIIFQAVDEASSVAGNIGKNVSNLGGAFGPLGAAAGAAFGIVTGGLGLVAKGFMSAFDQAAEFQQTMANINALLQLTPAMYEKVSTEVQRLGRETRFTVQEAGVAVEALVRGGGTVADIMAGFGQNALDLAAATKGAMDESAKVIMAVGHQYRLSSDEIGSSVNYIAGAINNANMTTGQFYDAFSKVGSLGYSLGVPMRDLTAGIAQFGQQGFIGESAGTALKTMLIYLTPKTKEAAEAFERYGLSVNGVNQFYDQSTGKLKPLGDVFQLLQDKFANMDTEERVQTFKKLFGIRANTMSMVLDASIEGAEGFKRFTDIMDKNDAAAQAEARMKSFLGAKEKFKGQLETLAIEVGLPFVELGERIFNGLIPIFEKAQPAISSFSDSLRRGLEGLPDKLREMTGIDLSKIPEALKAFEGKDFGAGLRDFLTQVLGPENMKRIDGIADAIERFAKWITDPKTAEGAKNIAKELGGFLGTVLDIIKGINDLKTNLSNLTGGGDKPKSGGTSPFGLLENMGLGDPNAMGLEANKRIRGLWDTITTALGEGKLPENLPTAGPGGLLNGILGDPYEAGQRTREKLGVFFDGIGNRINEAKPGISKAASDIWQSIQDGLSGTGATIGGAAAGAGAKAGGILDGILGSAAEMQAKVSGWGDTARGLIGGTIEGLKSHAKGYMTNDEVLDWHEFFGGSSIEMETADLLNKIEQPFLDLMGWWDTFDLGGKISAGVAGIGPSVEGALNGIGAGIGTAFDTIFGPVPEDVQRDLVLIRDRIITIGSEWVAGVQGKLTEISTNVSTKWGEIKTEIENKLSEISTNITNKWSEIKTTVSTALSDMYNDLRLKWDSFLREVSDKMERILSTISTKWNEISTNVTTKLSEIASNLSTKWEEMRSGAVTKWEEIKSGITGKVQEIWQGVTGKVEEIRGDVDRKWGETQANSETRWNEIKTTVVTKAGEILSGVTGKIEEIRTSVEAKWGEIKKNAESKWGEIKTSITGKIDEIKTAIETKISEFLEVGGKIATGIRDGFTKRLKELQDDFWNAVRDVLGWIKKLLGIPGSACRYTQNMGEKMGTGLTDGWEQSITAQIDRWTTPVHEAMNAVRIATKEEMAMLKAPFKLGENEDALERYRALRKLGMDMNRTGRGGFVAASARNYYDVWSRRYGYLYGDRSMGEPPMEPVLGGGTGVAPGAGGATGGSGSATGPSPYAPWVPPRKGAPQPVYFNISLNVDGIEVGRWNRAVSPDLGRQADRSMNP